MWREGNEPSGGSAIHAPVLLLDCDIAVCHNFYPTIQVQRLWSAITGNDGHIFNILYLLGLVSNFVEDLYDD